MSDAGGRLWTVGWWRFKFAIHSLDAKAARMRLSIVPLLAFVIGVSAHAAQPAPLDLQEVMVRQQQLRDGILAADPKYKDLGADKQQEMLDRSSQLQQMVAGRQSGDELTEAERKQVAEAVAWIDETLARSADDGRMICTYEKATGSHRKTRICRTAADIERERVHAQQHMSRPSACGKGAVGCRGG